MAVHAAFALFGAMWSIRHFGNQRVVQYCSPKAARMATLQVQGLPSEATPFFVIQPGDFHDSRQTTTELQTSLASGRPNFDT